MIGLTPDDGGGGYDPVEEEPDDDPATTSSSTTTTASAGSPGPGRSGGVIMDDPTGGGWSTYDPTNSDDPTDPSTGTVTTSDGQTEEIDLGTDRGQAVANSPIVDEESDDVTGSGTNPGGVQRETRVTGEPLNDAAEMARVGRWGPAIKLALIGSGVVVLGGLGLAAAGGDD